jgi:hypothetical protein
MPSEVMGSTVIMMSNDFLHCLIKRGAVLCNSVGVAMYVIAAC